MPLLYEGLFGFGDGQCHLRAYSTGGEGPVVLVVNLEDNPGSSAVNAAEILLDRIAAVFGDGCRLFSIFPECGDEWTALLPRGADGRATFRSDVTRRLASAALPRSPAHIREPPDR